MRTCKALAVAGLWLAVQTACVFGDDVLAQRPNPVGEKIYRAHMLPQLLPLAAIVFALLVLAVVAVIHKLHHKDSHPAPSDGNTQHC